MAAYADRECGGVADEWADVAAGGCGGYGRASQWQISNPYPGIAIRQGLAAFTAGDLRTANELFHLAVLADPRNDRANLYFALSRIAVKLLDDPGLASLMNRSGVVLSGDSKNICDLRAALPKAAPSGAPRTGEILTALREALLPEIDAAVANINMISTSRQITFDLMTLPPCSRPTAQKQSVELDYGDALVLLGVLSGTQAAFEILAAYDIDTELQNVISQIPQIVFTAAPTLLTLKSADSLSKARSRVDQTLTNFIAAITSIQAETDDQTNDLLIIDASDAARAQQLLKILGLVRQSLLNQVVLPPEVGLTVAERLDLSLFFNGHFTSLRPFLPLSGNGGYFNFKQFPDPTFGGVAPDLTQQDIDNFIKKQFGQ